MQRILRSLSLGNVDAGADIAAESAVGLKSGHAKIDNPPIDTVEPAQAVFHLELKAGIKRSGIGAQTTVQIIRVHTGSPTVSCLLRKCPPCEIKPALVEKSAELVRARHPDEHGSRVRDQPKTLLAFAQELHGAFPFRDVARNFG